MLSRFLDRCIVLFVGSLVLVMAFSLPSKNETIRRRKAGDDTRLGMQSQGDAKDLTETEVMDAKSVPVTLPALVGADWSSPGKLTIETRGQADKLWLTKLQVKLTGVSNMAALRIANVENNHTATLAIPMDTSDREWLSASWQVSSVRLVKGMNHLVISCRLKQNADIDDRVGVDMTSVAFSDGHAIEVRSTPSVQRLGIALRQAGDDGVHTYRIPGLATTNRGTLIGVYDMRHRGSGDLPGDIDVGMSRSTDGGQTWEPLRVIMDMGDDPEWEFDGIGDPAVLVDRMTGTIWVAATWSHGNRSWHGSGPGMTPDETGQLILVRSDDDGVTWSEPINITSQVKKPEWSFILQGPGKGIMMRDGTLVFAAQYQDPPDAMEPVTHRLPHSTIIFSRDHGQTWNVGTGAADDTTESQVVELGPGELMLNCRFNRKPMRVVMTTRDMGQTWEEHPTSQPLLIEPRSCMASLIRVDESLGIDSGKRLLFTNPDSTVRRHRMMIKGSPDLGMTWPNEHRLLLDEGSSAGYSCLSMIDEDTVGILYEGSQAHLTFQRISLDQVFGIKP